MIALDERIFMTYLFIGANTVDKQTQIANLKAKWAAHPDALQFDYQVLYGHKLEGKELKKSLLALPAILKERLIIIHEAEKLDESCKAIVLDCLAAGPTHVVLILECAVLPSKDGLWDKIRSFAKVYETRLGVKESVFDMTKKMTAGRTVEALQSLNRLYDEGAHPLQIMGGVVWAWGNQRRRVSAENFEYGLRQLQETDLNIKRSRLNSQQALEILVTKLAALR